MNTYSLRGGLLLLFKLLAVAAMAQTDTSLAPFYHGVASGDPGTNRITLWTRVTPPAGSTKAIPVTWKLSTDTGLTNVVKSGSVTARYGSDFTAAVTVYGLQPNTWYYYQFTAQSRNSLTGRTRTLPSTGVDSIRLAVVSCTNYQSGYFNVYRSIADRNDVDVVVHLGDFIYEYAKYGFGYDSTVNRVHDPKLEAITLSDYRRRHAQYRLDEDTRKLLQQYPLIVVWDDHEVANDAWMGGAENHDPATEGNWNDRLAAAKQAYFEWMPVKKPDPTNDPGRLYRQFKFGNLIRLDMLDTRLQGRTEQLQSSDPSFNDTSRTMLGLGQRNWLMDDLSTSTSKWNILGQQVMVAPMVAFGAILNIDQWDGYPAERSRLYNSFTANNSKNMVVLTGDIHSAWANDLPLSGYSSSNRAASAGVEFVCPSVTSPNPLSNLTPALIKLFNSHVRYVDLSYYGYTIINVTKTKLQGDWFGVSTIKTKTFSTTWKQSWYVNAGEHFLRQATAATTRAANRIVLQAPSSPQPFGPRLENAVNTTPLDVYPVPSSDFVSISLPSVSATGLLTLFDINGRVMMQRQLSEEIFGNEIYLLDISSLQPGMYLLNLQTDAGSMQGKLMKM